MQTLRLSSIYFLVIFLFVLAISISSLFQTEKYFANFCIFLWLVFNLVCFLFAPEGTRFNFLIILILNAAAIVLVSQLITMMGDLYSLPEVLALRSNGYSRVDTDQIAIGIAWVGLLLLWFLAKAIRFFTKAHSTSKRN
jgi:hypothetical protein